MKQTFMSFSFGCRVNEAEKQLLDKQLIDAGFSWDEKRPAFYIINSCAVTGKAEREVRQHIYQIRKKYPTTKIITTGCAASLWIKQNTKPEGSDYWIDNTKKSTIPELLTKLSKNNKWIPKQVRDDKKTHDKFLNSGRMMIKIQDGCNRFCSYCIVPFTRGRTVSRNISDILTEIQQQNTPIQEVILTAINTEYFGIDTGETLMQLVDSICTHTKIDRVSFGSIHPRSITPEFLSWYKINKDNSRFVHFFHVPIQSGSNTILKYMNRDYAREEILNQLQTIHSINPKAFIATDVIVGFPGEGEKEFEETYDFLKRSPISKFHVFRYSPRPGTAASHFAKGYAGQCSAQEKQKRSQKLRELEKEKLKVTTGSTQILFSLYSENKNQCMSNCPVRTE